MYWKKYFNKKRTRKFHVGRISSEFIHGGTAQWLPEDAIPRPMPVTWFREFMEDYGEDEDELEE